MLRVLPVDRTNLNSFLAYAAAHGLEHDGSYLPDARFIPSRDQPSYILMQGNETLGAVMLMRSARYRRVRRGRFALLHCVDASARRYALLLNAVRRHCRGLDRVYLFLPEGCPSAEPLLQLGFSVERYSYVMKADPPVPQSVVVPEGLALVPVRPSDPAATRRFARAINANFRHLAGGRAVGTVSIQRDADQMEAAEIGALSVDLAWRGRGLGRLLLRHGVCFAAWRGLRAVYLSVNAENIRALRLYQAEGFVVTNTMVCYARECDPWPEAEPVDPGTSTWEVGPL